MKAPDFAALSCPTSTSALPGSPPTLDGPHQTPLLGPLVPVPALHQVPGQGDCCRQVWGKCFSMYELPEETEDLCQSNSPTESPICNHDQVCNNVSVVLAELCWPAAWKGNPQHGHSYANKSICFTAASPRWSNLISPMHQPWGPNFHLIGQLEEALGCMWLWGVPCCYSVTWLSPLQPHQKGGKRGIGLVDLSWRSFLDSLRYSDGGVMCTKNFYEHVLCLC